MKEVGCIKARPHYETSIFIAHRRFLGVDMKSHPWGYCISSVLVLSLVMTERERWWMVLDNSISHNPSWSFLCPFKIVLLFLRILISFWSSIAMQSSLQSWPREMSDE